MRYIKKKKLAVGGAAIGGRWICMFCFFCFSFFFFFFLLLEHFFYQGMIDAALSTKYES